MIGASRWGLYTNGPFVCLTQTQGIPRISADAAKLVQAAQTCLHSRLAAAIGQDRGPLVVFGRSYAKLTSHKPDAREQKVLPSVVAQVCSEVGSSLLRRIEKTEQREPQKLTSAVNGI